MSKRCTEPQSTNELGRWLEKRVGWEVVALVGGGFQKNGMEDRLIIGNGGPWLVEFKNPQTPVKLNQKLNVGKHYRICGKAFIFRFHSETRVGDVGPWEAGRFEDHQGNVLKVTQKPQEFVDFLREQSVFANQRFIRLMDELEKRGGV